MNDIIRLIYSLKRNNTFNKTIKIIDNIPMRIYESIITRNVLTANRWTHFDQHSIIPLDILFINDHYWNWKLIPNYLNNKFYRVSVINGVYYARFMSGKTFKLKYKSFSEIRSDFKNY